jgi:phosphoenolpyruvate carboxylase
MRILLLTVVLGVVLGFLGRTKSLNLIPKIQRRNNFALAVAVAPNPIVDSTCKLPEIEDTCSSEERATNYLEIEESNEAFTAPLLEDIEKLSGILGAVIKSENKKAFDLYEAFKAHALARTNLDDKEALGRMINCAVKISPDDALSVIRAFTQILNLVNSAEVYHRLRLLRNADIKTQNVSPLPMREDSVAGTIKTLLTKANKQEVFDALLVQKVDIVLTAHPTEVNRRTLLRKYREISETLAALDRKDLSAYEKSMSEEGLRREIFSIWGSDEIRREKPTPQTEAKGGLAIVETVLWDAVPSYLRKLNAQCIESLDRPIPLDLVPIKFSSWMGGDRDGNPNVTPKVTYEVSTTNRLQAARLILADILTLYNELAICKGFSPDMLALAAEVKQSSDKRELYRRVLGHLSRRLVATIKWCENELEHADSAGKYI